MSADSAARTAEFKAISAKENQAIRNNLKARVNEYTAFAEKHNDKVDVFILQQNWKEVSHLFVPFKIPATYDAFAHYNN
jgi:hypothetical protein